MAYDDIQETRPKVLDLFCGAGGLAIGFQQAGFEIIGGIDNSRHAVESFDANVADGAGMVRDLRKGEFEDIVEFLGGCYPDVVVGGPSCQGFSTSGGLSRAKGRDESDPRNRLFTNYVDLVERLAPSWVVFENVPGLLLYNQGRVALEIVQAFREIGFNLVPMILLAADFGAPQLRRRLFFVGNRTDEDIPFPAATHGDTDLWRNYALPFAHLSRIGHGERDDLLPHVTFSEACGDLPLVQEGQSVDGAPYDCLPKSDYQRKMRLGSEAVWQHTVSELAEVDRLAAQTLEQGQNWRNIPLEKLPERFSRIRPYDATTILKRLSNDRPTYTITTKFNEGTTGAFIHPTQPRTLSLREAARLQGFPDVFRFAGSVNQIRQQIGNAVPVPLAAALAEAILPAVMRSAYGVTVPDSRDTVLVDGNIKPQDILKLKAPRKNAKPISELVEG